MITRGTVHGQSGRKLTRAYRIWCAMRQRCTAPSNPQYADYGGRGIKVCERWASFENFFADMGSPPEGLTLERIDNEGDYGPNNCRWATRAEQQRNRRCNIYLTMDGSTRCVAEWAEIYGVCKKMVGHRIKAGWDVTAAITTPPMNRGRRASVKRPPDTEQLQPHGA